MDAKGVRKLTILIPVYNEERTIAEILRRVKAVDIGMEREILLVNDGSTDRSMAVVRQTFPNDPEIRIVEQGRNRGKGAAVKRGLAESRGDFLIIQDADLEWDPRDFPAIIAPLREGRADAVFTYRMKGYRRPKDLTGFFYSIGYRCLAFIVRLILGRGYSDVSSCYKAFTGQVVRAITPCVRADGFHIDHNMAACVARERKFRVVEVPVRYFARTHQEGKKVIWWRDGILDLWATIRYRFFD